MFKDARKLGYAAGLCGVFLLSTSAMGQETLSPSEMKVAAKELLRAGQPEQADAVAQALIRRDPNDLTAHLVRARALRDMQQFDAAEAAAKKAWSLADSDGDRFAAAMIRAQVLSSAGKRTRAQLWLRRAAQAAPNKRLKSLAARDFGHVRQRNPWSTQLSFKLSPTSNINNGSSKNWSASEFGDTRIEYPLFGDSLPLSGFEYGVGVSTRYRFKQSQSNAHDLTFSADYRSYVLSSDAKDLIASNPDDTNRDITGSDFAFGSVALGYDYTQTNLDGRGRFEVGVETGQSWYGGARYASFQRLSFAQKVTHSRKNQTQYRLGYEWQQGQRTNDIERLSGSLTWLNNRQNGNLLSLSLGAVETTSNNASAEYTSVTLRSGLALAKPVMGAAIRFSLGAEMRDFDRSIHDRDGRHDKRIFGDVTATFKKIDYFGFNPSATVSFSHTSSNINRFDVNRFGVNFGIRSAF